MSSSHEQFHCFIALSTVGKNEDSCYQAIPEVLLKQGKVKNPYPNVDAHSFLVKALGDCFWSDFPSSIRPFCIILCIDCSTYLLKSLYCSVECAWWISKYKISRSLKSWSRSQWEKMKGGLAGSWQTVSPFFVVSFKITDWNHVDRNMGIQGVCVCAHVFFFRTQTSFDKSRWPVTKTLLTCCSILGILPSWHRDYFIRH